MIPQKVCQYEQPNGNANRDNMAYYTCIHVTSTILLPQNDALHLAVAVSRWKYRLTYSRYFLGPVQQSFRMSGFQVTRYLKYNIRHKDFRSIVLRPLYVPLMLPPLNSETGWTGELWLNHALRKSTSDCLTFRGKWNPK